MARSKSTTTVIYTIFSPKIYHIVIQYYFFFMISLPDDTLLAQQNLKNGAMFVEDVVVRGLNIAGNISEKEICNFRYFCRWFSSHKPKAGIQPIETAKKASLQKFSSKKISDNTDKIENTLRLIDEDFEQNSAQSHLDKIPARDHFEDEIVSILKEYLTGSRAVCDIAPIDLSQCGFKARDTSFYLLMNTSTFASDLY